MKLSEQAIKISTPGIQQVRRFSDERGFIADMIYDSERMDGSLSKATTMIDPLDFTKRRRFDANQDFEDLLIPVFRLGKRVYEIPDIHSVRAKVQTQLAKLHPGVKRFVNPHTYPVGLEKGLHELKTKLILSLREGQTQA